MRRAVAIRLLRIIALMLIGYVGLIVFAAYYLLHPPRHGIGETPRAIGLRYENVRFASVHQPLMLRGWYLPADGTPRGVVLFCHGRDGNRASVLAFAPWLHRAGYSILAFDFRACGESEGAMTTIGWQEVGDALGAVAYLRARPDTRRQPIGIFGVSMGAAVALQAAAQSPDIACVIADSPYASLDRAVQRHFDTLFGSSGDLWRVPIQYTGEWMMGKATVAVSPVAVVAKIAPRPLLLIHGTEDGICNVNDSRLLYAAAREPKQLWIVPGAGHVGSYYASPDKYRSRVLAILASAFSTHPCSCDKPYTTLDTRQRQR